MFSKKSNNTTAGVKPLRPSLRRGHVVTTDGSPAEWNRDLNTRDGLIQFRIDPLSDTRPDWSNCQGCNTKLRNR